MYLIEPCRPGDIDSTVTEVRDPPIESVSSRALSLSSSQAHNAVCGIDLREVFVVSTLKIINAAM